MKKLLMLAVAVTAFAIPASASALEFTHGGVAAYGQHDHFTGSFGWVFASDGTRGVHCSTADFTVEFTRFEGHVKSSTFSGCTTTSPVAGENNQPTDASAIGIANWKVTPISNAQIEIDNFHVNFKVTHPVTTHLVLAESTLTGGVLATVSAGHITHAVLSDTADPNGVHVQFGIPPAGAALSLNASGTLVGSGTIDVD